MGPAADMKKPTSRAALALLVGLLVSGCCETFALAPRPYVVPEVSFRPFVAPSATPRPTETPRPTDRPRKTPRPTAKPTPRPTAKPKTRQPRGHVLRGRASWYCRAGVSVCHYQYPDRAGFDAYAAAGPKLRRALGNWRGRIVTVNGIRVKLVDWCQCYRGQRHEKLIDLYWDVFRRAGSSVTIRW